MDPSVSSQASSHYALDPIPGSVLLEQEVSRRDGLRRRGNLLTGCRELDENVLLGGFERGCVVGISAEEEEIALLIGLQTIARLLARSEDSTQGRAVASRAVIVTTLATGMLLPMLRDVLCEQLRAAGTGADALKTCLRTCLGQVSISRVFDIEGLWEVLAELDSKNPESPTLEARGHKSPVSEPPPSSQPQQEIEIQDSEDEDDLSSAPSSIPAPEPAPPQHKPHNPLISHIATTSPSSSPSSGPEVILITHISTLLTALFARREKAAAHSALQLTSSHLRYLSRRPDGRGPLVLLLNATSPPRRKPPDPSLRSVFDRPGGGPPKPAFGLVFAQMLDVHLLATRVPRGRADAEAVFAPVPGGGGQTAAPRFAWVVECLLDEIGVWEEGGSGGRNGRPRRSREQRWGAVDAELGEGGGRRLVDAFEEARREPVKEVTVVGGFGGPRV